MDYSVSTIFVVPNWAIWAALVMVTVNLVLRIIEIRMKK